MLDRRDRQFVATLGFAAMLAVFLAVLAEAYAGVVRWELLAAGVWLALLPVAWKLTYRGFERCDVDPMEPSDLGSAVLLATISAAGLYGIQRVLPEAVPWWLQLLFVVAVLVPLSTRAYEWIAQRVPGLDPEYGS